MNCKVERTSTEDDERASYDDERSSYAPIAASARKFKTPLPMYKKTDIDPNAMPVRRKVGLESMRLSLNSSDYK